MKPPSLDSLLAALEHKQYTTFKNPKGYDLNIVGIRNSHSHSNTFDDLITVSYVTGSIWAYFTFPATTDPGLFFRLNPCNVAGTAILCPGQFRKAFRIGTHKDYEALVQNKPLPVYRDNNKDSILNDVGTTPFTGYHHINIHRASNVSPSRIVDRWSAGCQVFSDPIHFLFFMNLCRKSARMYGPEFTYTLIEDSDLR